MKSIFEKVYMNFNYKKLIIAIFFLLITGHILNNSWKHKNFYFDQYFLICMLVAQIIILKVIKSENNKINRMLSNMQETEVRGSFVTKTDNLIHPIINDLVAAFLVVVYIFSMYKVGCLEYTLTGYYFGLLGALIFYIGIQTYLKYVSLLYFAYDLRNLDIKKYFFYSPALTEWINQLAHSFSCIEKWLLILGSMYSIIYAVNLPKGAIIISQGISIHTPCNFLFLITWIGIIIFFALAIPSFIILSRSFVKDCIYSCKCKSINIIKNQIKILSIQSTEDELKIINMKISLINEISKSDNYPLKYSHTIFDNTYAATFTIVTLISPFVSIIEQLISKG